MNEQEREELVRRGEGMIAYGFGKGRPADPVAATAYDEMVKAEIELFGPCSPTS